ncbi:Uncharacterised protein [Staphylococcus petrasii]|uniref:Uncharacterized protein n=1 Tax=Staphylococcus petrasii TaxID=1276936 RepID=A0A380G4A4_9STAP|nr:hypothetical protein [Staphylococcus petrasii]PNZ30617.1 hypothetical protein CD137_04655 [Staphylococcus petrasii]TGE12373.1 hypothetical protein E2557_06180 [Staphylococcus petrasii]TGE17989.1 hypothetical protein BJR09_05580 [Staphylococcus petrasii]SUM45180.1 Uncharacterised protein [Staphylococcus petrasii]
MSLLHEKIKANYWKRKEVVGGHVLFEDNGFKFTAHALNIQKDPVFVSYDNIKEVKPYRSLGIIPNGVKVIDKDNNEHKLVVYQQKNVIQFLNEMKS